MTNRKLKPMITDLDTARVLAECFGDIIYNDITIINKKLFVSTTDEEVKKKDGRQSNDNL